MSTWRKHKVKMLSAYSDTPNLELLKELLFFLILTTILMLLFNKNVACSDRLCFLLHKTFQHPLHYLQDSNSPGLQLHLKKFKQQSILPIPTKHQVLMDFLSSVSKKPTSKSPPCLILCILNLQDMVTTPSAGENPLQPLSENKTSQTTQHPKPTDLLLFSTAWVKLWKRLWPPD